MRGDKRYYLTLHDGHGLYVRPEEERFVTAELIRHTTMSSPPEELRERIRALEGAGVKHIAFIPRQGEFDAFVSEFSDQVIARL